MTNVIKRSGKEASFNEDKILNAIIKANKSVDEENKLSEEKIKQITEKIAKYAKKLGRAIDVEEIQDKVEEELMKAKAYLVSKNYIVYRYKKSIVRKKNGLDSKILSLLDGDNEEIKQENANKNPVIISTQRDYMAGEVSRDLTTRLLLPKDISDAHNEGIIHFHDSDYFANRGMFNCCLIDMDDMLQNGTVISKTKIEKPHSFQTACNICTQVIAQVASGQYGGQSINVSTLAPFVDISRKNIKKKLFEDFKISNISITDEELNALVEESVKREVKAGVQLMQYQVLTLMTTNGQSPFVTFFMYLNAAKNEQEKKDLALIIEEILKQRLQGVKNEQGVWVSPAFPKLIYVLQENNIKEDSEYWYLTELAAKCSAKRLVPDYISEKVMKEQKIDEEGEGHTFSVMGCRSALSPYREKYEVVVEGDSIESIKNQEFEVKRINGKIAKAKPIRVTEENGVKTAHFSIPSYDGRFNQGVVTINLPYIALLANKNIEDFWKILDKYLELCHRALLCKHERLLGAKSSVSPIHWQYGAIARLGPDETIDKLLYNGYSTISLGYAGLWEAVLALNGKKLTEKEGESLGLSIMEKLNEYTEKWKQIDNLGWAIYGSPLESTTHKFAKALQKKFGKIKDISDHNYVTNSYHVCVREEIDVFSKLKLESKFQRLSKGGAISYGESANMEGNIPALLEVIKYIYNNIMYAEINTDSDYCACCGYDGKIEIVPDKSGKLKWHCPNCGNEDITNMSISRRICGYLSSANDVNQGRMADIKDRVLHI